MRIRQPMMVDPMRVRNPIKTILDGKVTVNTESLRIDWTGKDDEVCLLEDFYAALMELFDDFDMLDFEIPINADVRNATLCYRLGGKSSPWFFDAALIKRLRMRQYPYFVCVHGKQLLEKGGFLCEEKDDQG